MKKHIFSFICILCVVLAFCMTANFVRCSFVASAEDTSETTKKASQEQPYTEPETTTTTTQPPMPTKPTTAAPDPTEPPETQKTTESTTGDGPKWPFTTKKNDEPDPTEKPDNTETTPDKPADNTTKTTSGGSERTTERTTSNYTPYTQRTTSYVPRMTVPKVDNTQIDGTTVDPMQAYIERISGMTNTYPSEYFETSEGAAPEPGTKINLSTPAIVAICVGGIALVTVGLTAAFAIRNKRAGGTQDTEDDPYASPYDEGDDYPIDDPDDGQQDDQTDNVVESNSFTVVSLDDKDYKD
ncbi:MAG: hypothetical protein IJT44_10445 [Clostridia bacterium]|nr:hypothetical protein [Clostridia bacterium]